MASSVCRKSVGVVDGVTPWRKAVLLSIDQVVVRISDAAERDEEYGCHHEYRCPHCYASFIS
jgi:hypothetical protein